MPFERGSVSFRLFQAARPLPDDHIERFAQTAAPPVDNTSVQEEYCGWVTGRHLLDRRIDEHSAYLGGYLRLDLLIATKKIPQSLLQAECRMEELAELAASGRDFLNRKQRKEIRDSVSERLMPQMPYQLKGLPFVYDEEEQLIYAGALTEKDCERFAIYLRHTLGFELFSVNPEQAALSRHKIDVNQLTPISFTPEIEDLLSEAPVGRDFLTWLWFISETGDGVVEVPGDGSFSFMLQGPLTLLFEGHGAHETVLRKGEPLISAEARTCLLSGKKLKSSKLIIARDEEVWQCTLNADEFIFRGLSLPDSEEAVDPISRFQDRMLALKTFKKVFFHLYGQFLEKRTDAEAWPDTRRAIHAWVKERKAKS